MDPDPYATNPGSYAREPGTLPEYRVEPVAGAKAMPIRAAWEDKIHFSRWAFYAGLAGGILILLAAFLGALLFTAIAAFGGTMPGWAWWRADVGDNDGGFPEVPILIAVWGLVTGIVVLLCALRIKERPDEAAIPGIAMLVAGLLSFLALGGFLLGGIFAIAGGVLGIAGSSHLLGTRAPRVRREYAR